MKVLGQNLSPTREAKLHSVALSFRKISRCDRDVILATLRQELLLPTESKQAGKFPKLWCFPYFLGKVLSRTLSGMFWYVLFIGREKDKSGKPQKKSRKSRKKAGKSQKGQARTNQDGRGPDREAPCWRSTRVPVLDSGFSGVILVIQVRDLNSEKRSLGVTRDDSTVALCTLCAAATVLSCKIGAQTVVVPQQRR